MVFIFCLLLNGNPEWLRPGRLAHAIDTVMAQPSFAGSFWGVAVFAPARNRLLYLRNGGQNFRPASNMKILTTLLAFEYLGPEYAFETEFLHTGEVAGGVLKGDLLVKAGGDPAFSGNDTEGPPHTRDYLNLLVERLQSSGIREIRGDLVGLVDFFDNRALQKSWEWDDIGYRYATPVTPLSLHDGWLEIVLRSDEKGQVKPEIYPPANPDLRWELDLTHLPGMNSVTMRRTWGTDHFHITGNLPPCEEYSLRLSAWHPARQFLWTLKSHLAKAGIAVKGTCRLGENAAYPSATHLTSWRSPALADLAQVLMKQSQNHYADLFLKTTARHVLGEGSFENGAGLAATLLNDIARWSGGAAGFHMRDGSGLSGQNYLQPLQIIDLLQQGLSRPYQRAWLETFPLMGAEGTLQLRGSADGLTLNRVWAKTGYIFRTRCLSGYVETHAGEPLIFSIMVNNYGCSTAEVNRAQDQICGLLTRLKPNREIKRNPLQFMLTHLRDEPSKGKN